MNSERLVFVFIFAFAIQGKANDINIVMLTTSSQAIYASEFHKSIEHSLAYLDTRVLGNSGFSLKVHRIQIETGDVLSTDFLYGKFKYILGNASFFLLPYHIDKVCILGDMLKIPIISLNYEPGVLCNNLFSMQPDPLLLNQAVVTMIREDRPRVVAVIIEEGFGDFAMAIMSLDQQLNHFVFQIISLINFNNTVSVSRTVKELKESGTRKVFLVMQQENIQKFMREVHTQNFKSLHAYRWFTPVLDIENEFQLRPLEGLLSLSIPVDDEQLNKTMKELRKMRPSRPPTAKEVNPLMHDALATIAYATREFRNQRCLEQQVPMPASYCPIRRTERSCKSIEEYLSETMFRGLTGDVKFTKSRYRNITAMNTIEVNRGRRIKLGIWSVPCEAFKWDPSTTYAKQKGKIMECKKVEEEKKLTTFKPRKRNLRVVARIQPPFIFYDSLLKTENLNDRFSGFCKDILEKLSVDLDFKYDLYLVPDGKYGTGNANETKWDGMVGELIKKEADVAVGSLTVTSSRESVVDFSNSFMDFSMALLFKKPTTHHDSYFEFLKPFSVGLWLSIFISTMAVGFIIFIVERFSPFGYRKLSISNTEYQGDEMNLANSFWFVTASLLQQGPDHTPRSIAGRVLSASFWIFVTVITASYIASLVSFFLVPNSAKSISSLDDLVRQKSIKYGILQDGQTQRFLQSTRYPLYRKMYKEIIKSNTLQPSIKSAVDIVRKNQLAFLDDEPILDYMHKQNPCDTDILKHLITSRSYAFALQLSSEWTNPISVKILHLKETGFIESLRMKWWNDQAECANTKSTVKQTSPLGFRSLAGIIGLLAIGVSLSLIILLLEVKCKKWMKCLQSKRPSIPKKEQKVIKAPQITYLDYKTNGESYDVAFSKLYGSKFNDITSLSGSIDEQQQKIYQEAPESTL